MLIRCCSCKKEYDLEGNIFEYEKGSRYPILICPYCGLRHVINFMLFDNKIEKLKKVEKLDLTLYYPSLGASRIADANRVDKSLADNVPVTGWDKTKDFILATRIYGSKGTYDYAYTLKWRNVTDGGTFAAVGATGEISFSADTVLVDGQALPTGSKICGAQTNYTWQNGLESEGDNILPDVGTFALLDEYYTELQWALSCDDAHDGDVYEFDLFTNATQIGVCLASIKMLEVGWISPTGYDDPDNVWNTETWAYDNNTGTTAQIIAAVAQSWSSYLELTHSALSCSKVRFYAQYHATYINSISLDVYYDDGGGADWHNIYEGAFADREWVEKEIGSTQVVMGMRAKFYNNHTSTWACNWFEADFWEVAAGGPTENKKSVVGVLTITGNIIKKDSKGVSGVLTTTGKVFKSIPTFLAGAFSFLGNVGKTRISSLSLAGVINFSGAVANKIGKILTGVLATTGTVTKKIITSLVGILGFLGNTFKGQFLSLAGALTLTGAITNSTNKLLAGTLELTGNIIKSIRASLSGVFAFTGNIAKRFSIALAGTLELAGTLTKSITKLLSGIVTFTGDLIAELTAGVETFYQSVEGVFEFTGEITKRISISFGGAVEFVGSLIKKISLILLGTITFTGSLIKKISTILSGILTFEAVVEVAAKFYQTMTGSLILTGLVIKNTFKTMIGTLSLTGLAIKNISKSLSGILTFIGSVSTEIAGKFYKTITGVLDLTGSILKGTSLSFAGAYAFAGAVAKSPNKLLSGILSYEEIGEENWLEGWDKRRIKFTVDKDKIDTADLQWFRVVVTLSPTHGDCVFDELTSDANRFKIAFTKADGTTELYGEIEKWDDANESAIIHVSRDGWVISDTENTDFYMYYDKDHEDNTDYIKPGSEELVVNGIDWTGATGTTPPNNWTKIAGNGTYVITEFGNLKMDGVGADWAIIYQTITVVPGRTYKLSVDLRNGTAGYGMWVEAGTSAGGNQYGSVKETGTAVFTNRTLSFTATQTDLYIRIFPNPNDANQYGYVDNCSVRTFASANVWDTNSKMVQHAVDATTLMIKDSTSNNNDGTKKGAGEPASGTGKIGLGQVFDGANDYINVASSAALNAITNFTLSLWCKGNTDSSFFISKFANANVRFYGYCVATTKKASINVRDGDPWTGANKEALTSISALSADVWSQLTFVANGTTIKLYFNGVEEDTSTLAYSFAEQTGRALEIGGTTFWGVYWNGGIDEVQLSSVARTASWIKANYHSENDTLIAYGSEETGGGGTGSPGILIKMPKKVLAGALALTGSLANRVAIGLQGAISFIGSLTTGAAQLFYKALSGALSLAGSITKSTKITVLGAVSFIGNIAKLMTKSLLGVLTFTGSLGKAIINAISLAGSLILTGSITKSIKTTLLGIVNFTGDIVKAIATNLVGTLNLTGLAIRKFFISFIGSLSFIGAISKIPGKFLSGLLNFSGVTTNLISKVLAGVLTFTGTVATGIAEMYYQAVAGVLNLSGAITKKAIVTLSGVFNFSGLIINRIRKILDGVIDFTGSLTNKIGKLLNGTLTFTGKLAKRTSISLSGILEFLGTLISVRIYYRVLTGIVDFTGSIGKGISHSLEGILTFTSLIIKSTYKSLVGVFSFSGILNRLIKLMLSGIFNLSGKITNTIGKVLTGTVDFTSTLIKKISISLSGVLSFLGSVTTGLANFYYQSVTGILDFTGSIVKKTSISLSGVFNFTGIVTKLIDKLLTGIIGFSGIIIRLTNKLVSGIVSFTGNIIGSIIYAISLTGIVSFTGETSRVIGKLLEGTITFAGSILKRISIALRGVLDFVGSVIANLRYIFTYAELSIESTDTTLSIINDFSVLSIESNKSELSIINDYSTISIKKTDSTLSIER